MIQAVLQLLERAGILYCVLHGWERLGEEGSDVDIAVRPQDLPRAEELLHRQRRPCCVQLLQHESTGFYFVLAASEGSGFRFARLDLATDYRRNGRLLLEAAELLSGRRRLGGIWIASPAAEFSYLLAKKVSKGAAPRAQWQRLKILAGQLGPEAGEIVSRLLGPHCARRLLSWLDRGEWDAIEKNLASLRRSLRSAALRRSPDAWLRYWIPELGRIWRRVCHPAGLFVAVLGPDGSGKSTLLRRLPFLLGPPFRRSNAFHLRPALLPAVGQRGSTDDPHGRPPRAGLAALLKLSYLILDCCLGYLLRVRPLLVRSSLVLFDRYFHDLLVDPRRYRHGGPAWLIRLGCRLVPKPDLFLVIDVPLRQLRERKREVTLPEARRQGAAYRALAAELSGAVLLAGGRKENEVEAEAAQALLSFLCWRYAQRRRFWFRASREASREAPREVGEWPDAARYWRLSLRDGRGFILPLAPPRVAAAALQLYSAQSFRARVAKGCVAAGLATGLLQPLLPRLHGDGRGEPALLQHLQDLLGRQDLHFAACLGTPGAHRKPVIQLMEGGGRTLAFAKIGWNRATRELAENEAGALRRMAGGSFPHLSVPAVLHLGVWQDRLILLQSSPLPQATAAGRNLDHGYLEALSDLASLAPQRMPLGKSPFWESLEQQYALAAPDAPCGQRELLRRVSPRLREEVFTFCACHGDFVPWNVRLVDGRPFLFDWEYSRADWPAGYDLLHFLFQTRLLLTREPAVRIFREVLGQITRRQGTRAYWRRLGIEEQNLVPLMLLYLLERTARHSLANPVPYPILRRILSLVELALAELGWSS